MPANPANPANPSPGTPLPFALLLGRMKSKPALSGRGYHKHPSGRFSFS